MHKRVVVFRDTFLDSVSLMEVSNKLQEIEGIAKVYVIRGTSANKRILAESGFSVEEFADAEDTDLIVAVEGASSAIVERCLEEAGRLLRMRIEMRSELGLPRSLEEALETAPEANFVLISVPGKYAKYEAMKAIRNNLNVFLFSSNVPIEDEIEIKREAVARGVLVMGPDAGTAIINGVVFGFGNVVDRGPVGLVGSTGTGIQEATVILDNLGLGISHAIGTGSNDVSDEVGGIMTEFSLGLLNEDEETEVLLYITKPPGERTTRKIVELFGTLRKPVVACLLDVDPSSLKKKDNVTYARTIDEATIRVAQIRGLNVDHVMESYRRLVSAALSEHERLSRTQKYIRGLFAGGTLAYEAQIVLSEYFSELYSNSPIRRFRENRIGGFDPSRGHTVVDMGSEEFVLGRLHPMIDFTLRKQRIVREAQDSGTAVILLDIELGYGSHHDPAGELVPAIREAKRLAEMEGRYLSVIAHIVGTRRDPQNLDEQADKLKSAGVLLAPTNAVAARLAATVVLGSKALEKR